MNKRIETIIDGLRSDLEEVKSEIGVNSLYSLRPFGYKPIIKRVERLEADLEIIMQHLGLEVQRNRTVIVDHKKVKK